MLRALSRSVPVQRRLASNVRLLSSGALPTTSADPLLKERLVDATGLYPGNKHRSNAEELIAQVPVVLVKGNIAVCDGGGGVLGHPVEYIQLNKKKGAVETCKYCGLRYMKDPDYHGGH